jgi:hypothetical protein
MERVGGGCQWGGEQGREGAAAIHWGEGEGAARFGEERGGGSHPPDRDQWPKLALPFELPTQRKNAKRSTVF